MMNKILNAFGVGKPPLYVFLDAGRFDQAMVNLIAEDIRLATFFEKLSSAGLEGESLSWRLDESIFLIMGLPKKNSDSEITNWYNQEVEADLPNGHENHDERQKRAAKIYKVLKEKSSVKTGFKGLRPA